MKTALLGYDCIMLQLPLYRSDDTLEAHVYCTIIYSFVCSTRRFPFTLCNCRKLSVNILGQPVLSIGKIPHKKYYYYYYGLFSHLNPVLQTVIFNLIPYLQ